MPDHGPRGNRGSQAAVVRRRGAKVAFEGEMAGCEKTTTAFDSLAHVLAAAPDDAADDTHGIGQFPIHIDFNWIVFRILALQHELSWDAM